MFVPLVDITALNGGTEMQPGTHVLGEFDNQELQRERSMVPTLRAGQIVLMDFRTRHRGLGNNSQDDRPLLYFQYSVPGWKDPNFSARRYQKLPKLGKRMSREEIQQALMTYQQQLQEEQGKQMEELAQKNLNAGEAFLAENAEREGVETTESGLQYEVLEQGDGEKPTATDTVQVHYTGELLSGEVFDSSRERGEPVTFALNQVIPGWTEGLQLMSEGARYKLYIPSDLAYGPGGNRAIGPNETLVFDVELLEINPGSGD